MKTFEYDASGKSTYIFLLSALVVYLIPATMARLRGKSPVKKLSITTFLFETKTMLAVYYITMLY